MEQIHPVRDWRKLHGKTLADLAGEVRALGTSVSPSHLSEIENGNNEPSLDLAVKLSSITGIDVAKFAGRRRAVQEAAQ